MKSALSAPPVHSTSLPNCMIGLVPEIPPAYGGRHSADSLASPRDGRTGAWPKRRATRHNVGSARGERLRGEEEMGASTHSFRGLGSGGLGALSGMGKEERCGRRRASRALPHPAPRSVNIRLAQRSSSRCVKHHRALKLLSTPS